MFRSSSVRYRRTLFSLFVCACFVAAPATAQVSPWVDIEVYNGHVFVTTEIGGIPGLALIDTGAEINSINTNFLDQAELSFAKSEKIKIAGVYGTEYRDVYREVPITLFGSELRFNDLVGLELGSPDVQMIIGAGFLKLFVFQFDYPNQRMRLITRDSIDMKAVSNVESRQDRIGSSPIVKVRLNDEKDVWLLLDTGNNSGILLDRSVARKQKWLKRFPLEQSASSGVFASGSLEQLVLPTMKLGDFDIADPVVSVPAKGQETEIFKERSTTASRIKRTHKKSVGILGYDVLKHFVVTIDYATGLVHVEAGQKAEEARVP